MLYVDLHSVALHHCATHDSMRQGPQSPGKLSTSPLNESVKA